VENINPIKIIQYSHYINYLIEILDAQFHQVK